LLVMLVFGLSAAVASAGSGTSASDQYGRAKVIKPVVVTKGASVTKGVTASAKPSSPVSASGGSLPFTGVSLLWVIAVGAGLVIVGFVLRRRNERDQN
jgi:hypothetical protein